VAKQQSSAEAKAEQFAPAHQKAGRARGGKSRDAHWRQHTVLLEKDTHLTA
jgi:hypothetical protein